MCGAGILIEKSVTLINPPSPFLLNDRVHPPLGLMYIAAYLKENGIRNVSIADLSGPDFEKRLEEIPESEVYGITATTPQYGYAKEIRKFLARERPLSLVVLGGPHVTATRNVMEDGWRDCVFGDGERTMLGLVTGNWEAVEADGIDDLPFPARYLLDLKSYKYDIGGENATTMITSRSCPYSCAFCSKAPGSVRVRSAENVIAELDEIRDVYGYYGVMFYDDIFTGRTQRLREITEHVYDEDMVYRCFARANLVDDEIFGLLGRTGCFEVGFGAESGHDQILRNVNKKTTVAQNTNLVRLAHKNGVRVKAFLIAGLPGETEETLDATERWIVESGVDDFDMTVFTPYPGSDIYEHPEKYDIRFEKSNDFDKMFYKGKPGEYIPHISTTALSGKRIVERRDEIERKHKRRSG